MGDLREASRWNDIENELAAMIARIRTNEWELLSNKARHGLTLLKEVLYRYRMEAPAGSERSRICSFLHSATDPDADPAANLHELADEWLGIVQPLYLNWKRQQATRGTRDPVRLKGMTAPLLQRPLSTDVLRQLAESVQAEEPMRRRIVAAIIAVPTGKDFDRS